MTALPRSALPGVHRWLPWLALVLTVLLWSASLAIPVWETRIDRTGEWGLVPGILPALLGWLGILLYCPAWFANFLLIPGCIMLFKGRSVGFWWSVFAFMIAASAYMMPALYGDNDSAVIVGRKAGFYLWLGSFLVVIIALAYLGHPAEWPWPLVRWVTVGILLLAVVGLELWFRVGVPPLERALKDPQDAATIRDALARNPSQAEKDAALVWAMRQDIDQYRNGPGPGRIEQLIAAGADVNQTDRYNNTPLMQAVTCEGTDKLVDQMIRAGANVNARDFRDKTVLDIAQERLRASPQCLQMLKQAGALPSGKP